MLMLLRRSLALGCSLVAIAGLSACGGGGNSDKTVATVGKSTITLATLNHWMSTVVGGDYQAVNTTRGPAGLASEPADYPRCVSAAEQVVPRAGGKPELSPAQLLLKCHQLHAAVKEQALSYLIAVLWRAEEGAELHAEVSNREVNHQLQEIRYEQYKSPAAFNRYLADRHWTLGDERYLLKRNMLDTKFLARLKQQAARLGGGEQALSKLVRENVAKWTSRTSCRPGYLAWQCKQYGSRQGASPSASVLVEELRQGKA
jgi:hypothetical protein